MNPVTKEVSVWMGDPDEAYVIVPRDVGKAFVQAKHLSPAEGELRLKFDHHTRRFLCSRCAPRTKDWLPVDQALISTVLSGSESRLQLEIPQQMPFKSTYASNTGISDAILFHTPWSPTHTIAIENTPDCKSLFIPWRRGIPLLLTPVQIGLQDERLKATVY